MGRQGIMADTPKFRVVRVEVKRQGRFTGLGLGEPERLALATVEAGGHSLGLSRWLDREASWAVDSMFRQADCYPVFFHGEGDRCCRKQVAVSPLHEALEAELATKGGK